MRGKARNLPGSCSSNDNNDLNMESERVEYARKMRHLLSPPEIILPDGDIDQDFFLPARFRASKERYFAHEDREALAQALVRHGFGHWEAVRSDPSSIGLRLSQWTTEELERAAKQLVGCSDLERYRGWRPADVAALAREVEQNRARGLANGTWDASNHWLISAPEDGSSGGIS